MTTKILPHTTGWDMFITSDKFYIIRGDLDVPMFMSVNRLHDPSDKQIKVFDLPPKFQNGDHYYGRNDKKYVIRGNDVHRAESLAKDTGTRDFTLASNCRGGDHYLARKKARFIIRGNQYYKYDNFETGKNEKGPFDLGDNFRGGLCYYCDGDDFYMLRQDAYGVLEHVKASSLGKDGRTQAISKKILSFFPGGIALNSGSPSSVGWTKVKSIDNNSDSVLDWKQTLEYQSGSNATLTDSISHNWGVSISGTYSAGTELAKKELTLSATYGGSSTKTTSEAWSKLSTSTETLSASIQPGETWTIWQGKTDQDGGEMLFGDDLVMMKGTDAPDSPPW